MVLKGIKEEGYKEALNACWNTQLDVGIRGGGGFGPKLWLQINS